MKMNAKELRDFKLEHAEESIQRFKNQMSKNDIYIMLDNVLDTYNIGSVFRLADAVAAKKIFLCGGTATPPNPRIHKASINTTEWVDWEYFAKTTDAVVGLRRAVPGVQVVAVELNDQALAYDQFDYRLPVCLVVGHETDGVSKEVLALCDGIVALPMFGVNISLNVMVSLGIVLYEVIEKTTPSN